MKQKERFEKALRRYLLVRDYGWTFFECYEKIVDAEYDKP